MAGKQSTKNKQGSEAGFTEQEAKDLQESIEYMSSTSRFMYEDYLSKGLSRELARLVLPLNQYSRMRASANLRNWLAFLTLRQDPAAQFEIRTYADAVATIIEEKFPRVMELFKNAS